MLFPDKNTLTPNPIVYVKNESNVDNTACSQKIFSDNGRWCRPRFLLTVNMGHIQHNNTVLLLLTLQR